MIDLKKLYNKYSYPVPRYTSYPPANKFTDGISSEHCTDFLTESNGWKPENISIYIHIPFCNKMCHYCGCNMQLIKKKEAVYDYIDALINEIKLAIPYIDKNRKLSQIHFGGGTPNSIESKQLRRIVNVILAEFRTIDLPEIAIECNPAHLDYDYIDDLLDIGFNRISLGIQDFDSDVLKKSNRDASQINLNELFEYIRKKKSDVAINLDFIYGLPGQSVSSFLDSMSKAIALKPERLVTFSYAHVPWVNSHQKYLEKLGLPQAEDKIDMFIKSFEYLKDSSYLPIGMDHYVTENDELYTAAINGDLHRNFQGYCTRRTTGQVYAFGVSSISQLENTYVQNLKSTEDYIQSIKQNSMPVMKYYNLNSDEKVIREVINYLMCNKSINWNKISNRLENKNIDEIKSIVKYAKSNFQDFVDDGIIEFDGDNFSIMNTNVLFIRNVASVLDPEFEIKDGTYSKSV